jgi:hypothetical protein
MVLYGYVIVVEPVIAMNRYLFDCGTKVVKTLTTRTSSH